jgi:hypothetical protein
LKIHQCVGTEILLKHVREKKGENLRHYVRTRWNTLILAIDRFFKLIDCINEALLELGLDCFDENYVIVLRNVLITLQSQQKRMLIY